MLAISETEIFERINTNYTWFGPRNYLEAHTEFLQVVTYVCLRYRNSIAVYTRAGSGAEVRLHHLHSLGFGGHVQLSDAIHTDDILDIPATLAHANDREMREESVQPAVVSKEKCGLILMDDNEVSRHHAGLFEVWTLEKPELSTEDTAIANCRFMPIAQALEERSSFESWSAAVIPFLMERYGG